jgi:hypothetical protein
MKRSAFLSVRGPDPEDALDCAHLGLARETAASRPAQDREQLRFGFVRRFEQVLALQDVNVTRAARRRSTRKGHRRVMRVAKIDERAASGRVDGLGPAGAAFQKLDTRHRVSFNLDFAPSMAE